VSDRLFRIGFSSVLYWSRGHEKARRTIMH